MSSLFANSCDLLSASLGLTCTKSHQIFTTARDRYEDPHLGDEKKDLMEGRGFGSCIRLMLGPSLLFFITIA